MSKLMLGVALGATLTIICGKASATCAASQDEVAARTVESRPLPAFKPMYSGCGKGAFEEAFGGSGIGGSFGSALAGIGGSLFGSMADAFCGKLQSVSRDLVGNGGISFGNPYAQPQNGPDMRIGEDEIESSNSISEPAPYATPGYFPSPSSQGVSGSPFFVPGASPKSQQSSPAGSSATGQQTPPLK